jgi:hypothetical protein
MPKSVHVTEEERIFFLKSIEETFELKINSANDCELLSQIIFKETSHLISYNTLRRFFKILPNSNFPSLYTVNVLSKLIGFKDFNTLKEYRINSNRDFIHENLHLFNFSDQINSKTLKEIIPLLNEDLWENVYQIRSLIDLFIKKDEIEFISIFFNKEIDENDWEKMYKYYVAFQPIHIGVKLGNKKLIDFIKKFINHSKLVQLVLLQLYVEEDSLEGYYGEWVNSCSTYLTSDIEIFNSCIKIQYHFLKNEVKHVKNTLDYLNSLIKNYKNKIHPILLGRIAAWNFIISNDSSYLKRNIVINSDIIENIATITFFYRLVYLFGSKAQFVQYDYITLLQTENLQYSNMPFNIKTELSMYYLILTRYYVETNAKDAAFTTIQKIDKRYQFSCWANFFEKEYTLLYKTISQWK